MVTQTTLEYQTNTVLVKDYATGAGTLASPYVGWEVGVRNQLSPNGGTAVFSDNQYFQINTTDIVNNPATWLLTNSHIHLVAFSKAYIIAGTNYGDGILARGTQGANLIDIGYENLHYIGANLNRGPTSAYHQRGLCFEYVQDSWMTNCWSEQCGNSSGSVPATNPEGAAIHLRSGLRNITLTACHGNTSKEGGIDIEPNVNSSDIARNITLLACHADGDFNTGFHFATSDGMMDGLKAIGCQANGDSVGFLIEVENVPNDNTRHNAVSLLGCYSRDNVVVNSAGGHGYGLYGGRGVQLVDCYAGFNATYGFYDNANNAGGDTQSTRHRYAECVAESNGSHGWLFFNNSLTDAITESSVHDCTAINNTGFGFNFSGIVAGAMPNFRFRHNKILGNTGGTVNVFTVPTSWIIDQGGTTTITTSD